MIQKSQIPFLVRLLDDDGPVVRTEVVKALESLGPDLEQELDRLGIPLTEAQQDPIRHIFSAGRRKDFQSRWRDLFLIRGDKERLEAALTHIVILQSGVAAARFLPGLLDGLAEKYRNSSTDAMDALGLSRFLFREQGLHGVGPGDYLNPLRSNLVHVITEKQGLPITLACVFMLVGHRLGLKVEGCNFPGHFLAIAPLRSQRVLVDCYNNGRAIDETSLASINANVSMKDLLRLECRANAIIARVLRNLINAGKQADDAKTVRLLAVSLRAVPGEGRLF